MIHERVRLSGFEGWARRVSVRVVQLVGCVPLVLILMSCGGKAPGEPGGGRPPNILLITLDTLRADYLGIHGGPAGLTPRIDRFAQASIVFERASTTIGTTFPAHASIFTGLYPKAHGVRWNGDRLDENLVVLAEVLSGAGYETAAFVSFTSMLTRGGMDQGFAVLDDSLSNGGQTVLGGERINQLAIPWLARRDGTPFFLWLHYFEAHSPYRLTSYAKAALARSGYRGPLSEGASTHLFYSLGREIPWTPEEREALRTLYAGEVAELDRLVGEILDQLWALDLMDDTLVILTSDHGQALGEHDQVGHGFLLSEPVVRIPLVLGGWMGIEGRRVIDRRVGLIDLAPTVLDLLSVPQAMSAQGHSIAPALWGKSLQRRPYFVEVRDLRDNRRWSEADAAAIAVLDQDLKAIWRPDGLRWFDLELDPGESNPAATSIPRGRRNELRRLLERYRADSATMISGSDPPTVQVIEELKSLGYVQ